MCSMAIIFSNTFFLYLVEFKDAEPMDKKDRLYISFYSDVSFMKKRVFFPYFPSYFYSAWNSVWYMVDAH